MKQQDTRRLFTRFGKLQRTAAGNSEGLGLGLTIVQQIVNAAGGRVWASSPGVGCGSTFFFQMRLDADEADAMIIEE